MLGYTKDKIYIIAEAGVNHNGDLVLAKKLADAAKSAGADAVKYQTFISENCITVNAPKADYQMKTTGNGKSQLEMVKSLELSFSQFGELKKHCDDISIQFLSTPFDLESVAFLDHLDLPFWKIPSGEITNVPYLIAVAKTNKPTVMSTGMSNIDEIKFAFEILSKNGAGEITLLHCNTEYPTPPSDVNLRAMVTLREEFGCNVGYSDHTVGIEIPIAAAAMGASIIEKHFTLDNTMTGPDHRISLTPKELKAMIMAVRNVEQAMGSRDKKPSDSEKRNIEVVRKSIVAKVDIQRGQRFTEDNITTKRPGCGISPTQWTVVMGMEAKRDFQADELIEL